MYLYLLSFSSGKNYIGQTQRSMKVRMLQHRNSAAAGSQLAVHCAWRKHGEPNCKIIGTYQTADELHAAEIAAIIAHNTISPNGYNVGFGGETAPSKNAEVAAKIAAKATGRKATQEFKDARRVAMAIRMADPAYREKMLRANAEYWTPERRAERAEATRSRSTGVKFSDERRRKIGDALRDPKSATRMKMSASAKARGKNNPFSPECREKISSSAAASWADPEIRARRSAAIKAAWAKKRESKETTS